MKIIRIILFPIVPFYYFVTWLRNKLYDYGLKPSRSYDFPVICVGNLSTGGTGKTPMIEYLIRLLKKDYNLATLSRGYMRKTKGFVLANDTINAEMIGDEPFQFYRKFPDVNVAVDANRQNGIFELQKLRPKPEVVLLDDAFQHRKVNATFNIMLTAYHNLFYKDIVLPTGNLREPRSGYKRANIIVVTKCPVDISRSEKIKIKKGIHPTKGQHVFFSSIAYSKKVYSRTQEKALEDLPNFTLVTGIANANPLVEHLRSLHLSFQHLEFKDHYNFTEGDIENFEEKKLIITTEKDFARLSNYKSLKEKLYYLPINIIIDEPEQFQQLVKNVI